MLLTAEMLKPPMPTSHCNEELVEYFPQIVFVHNKSFYSDFSVKNIKTVQVSVRMNTITTEIIS